jgi:hypothetical protein
MLRRVVLVRTDVSEEPSVSFIRVTRIGELGTSPTQAATINRRTLRRNTKYFTDFCHPHEGGAMFLRNVGSYKSQRRNIPEDTILHSHRRENLKSYKQNKQLPVKFVRKGGMCFATVSNWNKVRIWLRDL